jgi:hypothetical protein
MKTNVELFGCFRGSGRLRRPKQRKLCNRRGTLRSILIAMLNLCSKGTGLYRSLFVQLVVKNSVGEGGGERKDDAGYYQSPSA